MPVVEQGRFGMLIKQHLLSARMGLLLATFPGHAAFAACPPLENFYPIDDAAWNGLAERLQPLLGDCLDSSEYFALLGAAQMQRGDLAPALESLERALLLDPANAGARIDYAEALFHAGQLFPALELNRGLLQRPDTPAPLVNMLEVRQALWQRQTTRRGLTLDLAGGYDNNLNGAPASGEVTLTLSGESITLALDEDFRPLSGPYANTRLSGYYQKLRENGSHDLQFGLRSRNSEHTQSDLVQMDWRYAYNRRGQAYAWTLGAGTSHLMFGGSPLYAVSELRGRARREGAGCQPQYELVAQYQRYHSRGRFSGVESAATTGFDCRPAGQARNYGLELGLLGNYAQEDDRPGGDRQGWQARLYWQEPLAGGTLRAQYSISRLDDDGAYSPIIAFGAQRSVTSRFARLQYQRPITETLGFSAALTHQRQGSNLGPFNTDGTALELGFSLAL